MKHIRKDGQKRWVSLLALSLLALLIFPTVFWSVSRVFGAEDAELPLSGIRASSTFREDFDVSNLLDGNAETFWTSVRRSEYPAPEECDYVILTFAGRAEVSRISLTPRQQLPETFPRDFKLQYSPDKKTWIDIPGQSYTDYAVSREEQVFSFEPVTAKQVRILGTLYHLDDARNYFMQLSEMRAFGRIVEEAAAPLWGRSPIAEPYDYVEAGGFVGPNIPASPDPLVNYRFENPGANDPLAIFLRRPVAVSTETPASFSGLDSLAGDGVSEGLAIEVRGDGTLAFDFGAEYAAWLEFDCPELSGKVTMSISEYNEIPHFPPNIPAKTAEPVRYGDSYRLELNSELYEGVRFGFLRFSGVEKPFTIRDVRLVCQTKPVNYEGSFDSDNELLNRIWYTAAYSVRANLRDYFSAILIDRGDRYSWTGDAYPAQAASLAAFGNFDAVLKNLCYTAESFNGFAIESYDLYWVYSLIDYYEYTGDKEGVGGLLEQARKRLDHAYEIYGKNPSLVFFGWDERLGSGFDNPDIPENQNAYKMLAIRAWQEFAPILEDLGYAELAARYRGYATEKTVELTLTDAKWYKSYGLHASADAINAGLLTGEALAEQYERYFTDRLNCVSYSPFNQYFILQAIGNAGAYDDAISSVLDLWGGQVAYGGTTFFEVYRPGWNEVLGTNAPVPNNQVSFTSLAHSWGAGVLPWLSEEVLGIKADSAGYKTFTVAPHLGRQLTRVSGSLPTGNGLITASFNTKSGLCSLTVPVGTVARVGIPKVEKKIVGLTVNGSAAEIASEDEEFVYIEGLTGGSYSFVVTYEGETPAYTESPYVYPAEFVGADYETAGDWGDVYGSEGYLLFGEKSVQQLPDYVKEVRLLDAYVHQWEPKPGDPRALAGNPFNLGERALGTLYSRNYSPTFALDILLSEKRDYTVALYFADFDAVHTVRQVAVQMFDADTLEIAAPIQVLRDYTGGAYLIYRYDRSARFRVDQIRGANATLSALFFGEGRGPVGDIRTSETLDDHSDRITYAGGNWTQVAFNGCYMNTFSNNNRAGTYAELTFEGTGVSLLSSLEFNRGMAEILIDGISRGKVDLFAPRNATKRQVEVFSVDGLTPGSHTIRVVATGEKNSAAEGTYIEIDAFVIRNETSAAAFVAENLTVLPLRAGDRQIALPAVPEEVEITLTASGNPAVISTDGRVQPPLQTTEVLLTFTVRADGKEATAEILVTVPAYLPPFSEGEKAETGEPGTYTLSSPAFSAFVSSRRVKDGVSDLRFVLAADRESLTACEALYMTVTFEDGEGRVVKSLTENVETELLFYAEVLAGGHVYRAAEGCALFGLIITDVPDGAWQRVRVTLSVSEDPASVFMGGVLSAEALFA